MKLISLIHRTCVYNFYVLTAINIIFMLEKENCVAKSNICEADNSMWHTYRTQVLWLVVILRSRICNPATYTRERAMLIWLPISKCAFSYKPIETFISFPCGSRVFSISFFLIFQLHGCTFESQFPIHPFIILSIWIFDFDLFVEQKMNPPWTNTNTK